MAATTVYKWRIWCQTEGAWVYAWAETAPTACPTNTADTIDPALTEVVDQVSTEIVKTDVLAGGAKTLADGFSLICPPGQWSHEDYTVPENYHLQGTFVRFTNAQAGDKGALRVSHPGGDASPAVAAAAGATSIDMGAAAPYYDPLVSGAQFIEFWNSDLTTLLEVRGILSVAGTVVNLDAPLANPIGLTDQCRSILDSFTTIRGANGTDGGMRLLGNAGIDVFQPGHVSDVIPAGIVLSASIYCVPGGVNREFAVNYLFRRPTP